MAKCIAISVLLFATTALAAPVKGPAPMKADDYETRYLNQLQNARLERAADPFKLAEERVKSSRIREYPGEWSARKKRARYAWELKRIKESYYVNYDGRNVTFSKKPKASKANQ